MAAPSPARPDRLTDTSLYPRADREDVWRAVFAPRFELSDLPDDVAGVGLAYLLGPVTVTRSRHPRQRLLRSAQQARADSSEDIFCSIELSGGFGCDLGDTRASVGVGAVTMWDLARPTIKDCLPGETLCVHIDRDAWRRVMPEDVTLHGLTLGPMATLARDHMLSLERTLAANPGCAKPELGMATVHILAACARQEFSREALEPARGQVALLAQHRAERYMKAHLGDPDLSPDRIARAVGVSRSGLYALFEASGGVAARIRTLRLELAHAMLAGAGHRRIGDIALDVGFAGSTQFNRAFKAHFGYPPGETRKAG